MTDPKRLEWLKAQRRLAEPPPWVIRQRKAQAARNRALGRLRERHRAEYDQLVIVEMTRPDPTEAPGADPYVQAMQGDSAKWNEPLDPTEAPKGANE